MIDFDFIVIIGFLSIIGLLLVVGFLVAIGFVFGLGFFSILFIVVLVCIVAILEQVPQLNRELVAAVCKLQDANAAKLTEPRVIDHGSMSEIFLVCLVSLYFEQSGPTI
jgi:hypothetical protein